MRSNMAIVLFAAVCLTLMVHGAGMEQGLDVIKQDVREELDWLNRLDTKALAAFLAANAPAVNAMIDEMGKELPKASPERKTEIRDAIADLLEVPLYLYRDYTDYLETAPAKAKLCTRACLLEDMVLVLELDLERLKNSKAKNKEPVIQAKHKELEKLESALERLYDKLDAE